MGVESGVRSVACATLVRAATSSRFVNFDAKALSAFPLDGRYLVGVSGGRDSVALLHWLLGLGYDRLILCHLEHGLRGRAGRSDARFVADLAEQHDLVCEIGTTDVRALAAREKVSIETAARIARYAFYAKVAARRRCRTIFLGHHADDLVETFLINLFRGAGAAGLSSLREISSHQIGKTKLMVVRPLLTVWRKQIDDYIRANQIPFREDQTNKDLGPLRNRDPASGDSLPRESFWSQHSPKHLACGDDCRRRKRLDQLVDR